jgi:Lsr2
LVHWLSGFREFGASEGETGGGTGANDRSVKIRRLLLQRSAASRDRSGDIRTWAKNHGITVSDRGRIPASVAEQYEACH